MNIVKSLRVLINARESIVAIDSQIMEHETRKLALVTEIGNCPSKVNAYQLQLYSDLVDETIALKADLEVARNTDAELTKEFIHLLKNFPTTTFHCTLEYGKEFTVNYNGNQIDFVKEN